MTTTPVYTVTSTPDEAVLLEDGKAVASVVRDGERYTIVAPAVLPSDVEGWHTPDFALRHAASYLRIITPELRAATDAIYVHFYPRYWDDHPASR